MSKQKKVKKYWKYIYITHKGVENSRSSKNGSSLRYSMQSVADINCKHIKRW